MNCILHFCIERLTSTESTAQMGRSEPFPSPAAHSSNCIPREIEKEWWSVRRGEGRGRASTRAREKYHGVES